MEFQQWKRVDVVQKEFNLKYTQNSEKTSKHASVIQFGKKENILKRFIFFFLKQRASNNADHKDHTHYFVSFNQFLKRNRGESYQITSSLSLV